MTAAPYLWEAYQRIDARLAACGVPLTPPWWNERVCETYLHPTASIFCARVGRGGDKSTVVRKRTLANMLAGSHNVPAGERHWHVGFSNRLDEAKQAVAQLSTWLDFLHVGHRMRDDQITLDDLPVGFWALPCSNKAARGPRAIGGYADELASWSVDGQNPAAEVAASMMAMGVTHPGARFDFVSSPMGHIDYHAQLFARGNTEHQLVAWAPSWVANPEAITEESAWKAAGGDQRTFDREYRAIPQDAASACFDEDEIAALTEPLDPTTTWPLGTPLGLRDGNGGGTDNDTNAQCQYLSVRGCSEDERYVMVHAYDAAGNITHRNAVQKRDEHGKLIPNPKWSDEKRILYVSQFLTFEGATTKHLSGEDKIYRVSQQHRRNGVRRVFGDSYSEHYASPYFQRAGLQYTSLAWRNDTKAIAVARLRALMRERAIRIEPGPEAEKLKDELRNYREKITPSGLLSFEARSGRHDDRVALLLNAAMLDVDGKLSGSPIQQRNDRIDSGNYPFG